MKTSIFSFIFLFLTPFCIAQNVDILIFSYHRPLQLYALLESINTFMSGYNDIYVLYRADNQQFDDGYKVVKDDFPSCIFIKQSQKPHEDFKPLTLQVFTKNTPYILFGVDDIIIKDYVDLHQCVEVLEKTHAYGFFLRLGTNLSYCYSMSSHQSVPPLELVQQDRYIWRFSYGIHDWHYPFNLDMTLYNKNEIISIITHASYKNPTKLEVVGTGFVRDVLCNRQGACFNLSKIVNIPLNIIQTDSPGNNHLNRYTIDYLLQIFNEGYKIDIQLLKGILNRSAHADIELNFIKR